ncbi:MAG: hypothetical protein LH603_19910 [Pseudonocardia sp.]|nr:hypothetical protein [Pseudonocardia sp.]
MTDPGRTTCIDEAAILVATQPGAAARLRARHRSRGDGCCTGCGPTLVPWPCVHITIADRADHLKPRPTDHPATPRKRQPPTPRVGP